MNYFVFNRVVFCNIILLNVLFFSTVSLHAGKESSEEIIYEDENHIKRYGAGRSIRGSFVYALLKWLMRNQNKDGSWGEGDFTVSLTALVLFDYLLHGETPSSMEMGESVKRAMEYLETVVKKNGGRRLKGGFYPQALTTLSLSCAYTLLEIPALKKTRDICVKGIVDGINSRGCYNVGYDNSEEKSDCKATVWNAMALAYAKDSGCEVPGLDACLKKVVKGLLSLQNKKTYLFAEFAEGEKSIEVPGNPAVSWMVMHALNYYDIRQDDNARKRVAKVYPILSGQSKMFSLNLGKEDKYYNILPVNYLFHKTMAVFLLSKGTNSIWQKWYSMVEDYLEGFRQKDSLWISPCARWHEDENIFAENLRTFKTEKNLKIYTTALYCQMNEYYYAYSSFPSVKVDLKGKESGGKGE